MKLAFTMVLFLLIGFMIKPTLPANQQVQRVASGKIAGIIYDQETGEPLIGANVIVKGTPLGASTDLDGTFIIETVPPGDYTIQVFMIGYQDGQHHEIRVEPGKVTHIKLTLQPQPVSGEEVTVEARFIRNNEMAIVSERKRSMNVEDGISREMFSRSGASDLASAIKQITGATLQDGQYLVVRGLGDRYSTTRWDGIDLPQADPDRKSFQLDLIPTELLEYIVVRKSFTPDQPGNFSGGALDIGTLSFPDRFQWRFSGSIGYDPLSNLNGAFLSAPDRILGFWGGGISDGRIPSLFQDPQLQLPTAFNARRNPEKAALLDRASRLFSPTMSPVTIRSPLNRSLVLFLGNSFSPAGRRLGVLFSVSYRQNYQFYKDGQVARWKLTGEQSRHDSLTNLIHLQDQRGTQKALWGLLFTASYQLLPKHRIQMHTIYTGSVRSMARYLIGRWPEQLTSSRSFFETRVQELTRRRIEAMRWKGEHEFSWWHPFKLSWQLALASTFQDQPDVRFFSDHFTRRTLDGRDTLIYAISPSIYPRPSRYFRYLKEKRQVVQLRGEFPQLHLLGLPLSFAFGASWQRSARTFRERLFEYWQGESIRYQGNPFQFFAPENTGIIGVDTLRGVYRFGNYIQESVPVTGGNYDGEEAIDGYFGMMNLKLTANLQLVGGVRFERTWMELIGKKGSGYLNDRDWLPSLNLRYQWEQNHVFRLAYSRTLARPGYREKAPYASYQFVNDVIFNGNASLKRTRIQNLDLRWEWFPLPGELYAISLFGKWLKDPIERVIDLRYASEGAVVTYQNVPYARVLGVEFELRTQLGRFWSPLNILWLRANLSLVNSQVTIPEQELLLIRSLRPDGASTRPLQGQAPYTINISLTYSNAQKTLEASFYYHLNGPRLSEVSLGGTPNVYEWPRHELNASLSFRFWKHLKLTLKGRNLLNQPYQSGIPFKGIQYVRQSYPLARQIAVSLSYTFQSFTINQEEVK